MTPGRRRLRVLIVEDDPRITSLIADVLEDTADVHGVPDARQAVDALARARPRHFHLVIVDCLLPGPDGDPGPHGVDLVGTIHAERPGLPILAVTGAAAAEGLIIGAFRNGARDFLRKPFGVEELRATVARLVPRMARHLDARPRAADAGVARVLAFLAEHFGQPVSLEALARVAAMSRSHLSRSFRSTVGVPLRVYVRNLRLERAQQMLVAAPGASLTQVALEAGFYDLPHLDKAFRERFGISPSEFMRRRGLARMPPTGHREGKRA
jgi:AraC-like DNA-binding protein